MGFSSGAGNRQVLFQAAAAQSYFFLSIRSELEPLSLSPMQAICPAVYLLLPLSRKNKRQHLSAQTASSWFHAVTCSVPNNHLWYSACLSFPLLFSPEAAALFIPLVLFSSIIHRCSLPVARLIIIAI